MTQSVYIVKSGTYPSSTKKKKKGFSREETSRSTIEWECSSMKPFQNGYFRGVPTEICSYAFAGAFVYIYRLLCLDL